jgi:hypothetical protein
MGNDRCGDLLLLGEHWDRVDFLCVAVLDHRTSVNTRSDRNYASSRS